MNTPEVLGETHSRVAQSRRASRAANRRATLRLQPTPGGSTLGFDPPAHAATSRRRLVVATFPRAPCRPGSHASLWAKSAPATRRRSQRRRSNESWRPETLRSPLASSPHRLFAAWGRSATSRNSCERASDDSCMCCRAWFDSDWPWAERSRARRALRRRLRSCPRRPLRCTAR